ncbi:MAG TPA: hypothetical protein VNU00_10915, partial [Candidatus Binataceae bacterium]|nr:hypothetical protein [Candidatus Binataceae bacterium]
FPNCFLVPTTERGLLDFSWECSHFNFVLMPSDRSATVLCTVYDYFLVAGPQHFVTLALGGAIEAARKEFDEEAVDPCWEGRLQRVAERYRSALVQ